MKQTAVEWLDRWFRDNPEATHEEGNKALEQAKEMEKEQIIDAFDEGQEYEYQYHINNAPKFDSATYFAETYGSKGSDGNFKQFSLYEHKETIATSDTPTSSQTEISDEEIKKAAHEHGYEHHSFFTAATSNQKKLSWIAACKWYREQLKQRQ